MWTFKSLGETKQTNEVLTLLSLAGNRISGQLPAKAFEAALWQEEQWRSFQALQSFNAESNFLSGTVPQLLVTKLSTVRLAHNPGLVTAENGILPPFLAPGKVFSLLSNVADVHGRSNNFIAHLLCPNLLDTDNPEQTVLTLDPTYFNHSLCECDAGTFWDATTLHCAAIPLTAKINGSSTPKFQKSGNVSNQKYAFTTGLFPVGWSAYVNISNITRATDHLLL